MKTSQGDMLLPLPAYKMDKGTDVPVTRRPDNLLEVKHSPRPRSHLCDLDTIYLRRKQEVEDAMATDNGSHRGKKLTDKATPRKNTK